MPICSYVVFPEAGRGERVARSLGALEECQVEAAENREMLLLVTVTESPDEDRALRQRVESEEGIECMVMAFGEIDPETEERDPVATARASEGAGRGPASGSGPGSGPGRSANVADKEI